MVAVPISNPKTERFTEQQRLRGRLLEVWAFITPQTQKTEQLGSEQAFFAIQRLYCHCTIQESKKLEENVIGLQAIVRKVFVRKGTRAL